MKIRGTTRKERRLAERDGSPLVVHMRCQACGFEMHLLNQERCALCVEKDMPRTIWEKGTLTTMGLYLKAKRIHGQRIRAD